MLFCKTRITTWLPCVKSSNYVLVKITGGPLELDGHISYSGHTFKRSHVLLSQFIEMKKVPKLVVKFEKKKV